MKLIYTLPLLASCFMVGCSDPTDYDFDASITDARADVDPPVLPFPSSLFLAATADGTLDIPLDDGADAEDFSDPLVALNTLDGFSTTQPLTSGFVAPLDAATLIAGDTVRVFQVTATANGIVTDIVAEVPPLTYATAVSGETTLVVQPLVPLSESSDYMVVVTNGVTDITGAPARNTVYRLTSGDTPLVPVPVDTDGDGTPDPDANAAPVTNFAALEPLRQLNGVMLQVAAAAGIDRNSVVQIWSVKTQSITPVLNAVKEATQAGGPIAMQSLNVPSPLGAADIFAGTLTLPYYLTVPTGSDDRTAVVNFWRGAEGSFLTRSNTMPVEPEQNNGPVTVPVLMTVPNASSGQLPPDAGWPVAIFVHGITRNRGDMLALADSMAIAGFAVIAIDQPMHGIDVANPDEPTPVDALRTPIERTFDLDLSNNETGATGADGLVDSSGTHFFSPAQLLNTRDNIRQSVADLLVLSASIANISAAPLDVSRKALIGYSLGGTTATTFAALDETLSSVSLVSPAAGLVPMTLASPAFRDPILAGLEAVGLVPGTPDFNSFVIAAQTVIDGADPINFAAQAASMHQIHMIEVVGDEEAGVPSDQVVLNDVAGAVFSGSAPLARVMGLPMATATTSNSGVVRFIRGDHGSLLDPATSLEATSEMQRQVAAFAATGGTLIQITDSSVILTSE